jgi:aldehyde:ferredoxin oxidoreductase
MNKLPKKQIEKLKEIFLRVYGIELSDEEADCAAEQLFDLIAALSKVNSKNIEDL